MTAPRRARTVLRAAGAAALWILLTGPARAQPLDSLKIERRYGRLDSSAPGPPAAHGYVLFAPSPEEEAPPASQHRTAPLTGAQAARLHQAGALRRAGQLEPARAALAPLLAALPHHPAVVTEAARLLLAKQDFAGVERLGRFERAARRDSLVLARELSLALERLGRPREAAGVALEAWVAAPREEPWAAGTILRLAPADLRGVRELLRRAVDMRPGREDLVLAKARLDWRGGDLESALATLERAERPGGQRAPLRWEFATELTTDNVSRDSSAAVEALVRLAGDSHFDAVWRLSAAQRAWELQGARGAQEETASGLARALKGVPTARWPADFLVSLARTLRQAGRTDQARSLLRGAGGSGPGNVARGAVPQLDLEEALADLRDGPPERALPRLSELAGTSPEGAWRYAEALFFAGQSDSALACYQRIAGNPEGTFSGAALERVYLIEEADPPEALPLFGRAAYEEWRGDRRQAMALTDSLVRTLPRQALWAQAAVWLGAQRDAAGDTHGALAALLAVADSLPDDRLAPLARQRAGDIHLLRLKDERAALAQYEECLARYPRAWNAPEVRRRAEQLRRGPRL